MRININWRYIFVLMAVSCQGIEQDGKQTENTGLKPASEYFPAEKAKILVVGTFHFDYPGRDAINAREEDKIDVLKEPKKSEVTELVHYIERFHPNKIAIEAFDAWEATQKLRKYRQGAYRDQRDERYQLGMRIATDLQLDTLYAIDATTMSEELEKRDSVYTAALFKDFDFKNEDPMNARVWDWVNQENQMVSQVNLKEYISHMNSRESHRYGYGAYLVGDFKLGEFRGADILASWWYDRNLRIFRNIQKITTGPKDRILVIIGNGHAAILRQLIECSPEYEFVEFDGI